MDHWQVKCKTVMERIAHILETGFRSDCTFQVGSSQHQLIKAHRTILAAASPVLDAMLFGTLAETKTEAIVISDVEPATFNSLLGYVYTDRADINSVEEACQLYYAAKKYILPGLQEICMQYIIKGLSLSNVCQLYEFAKFYETSDLKEKCLEMMGEESEAVLGDDTFRSAELQTVVDIFSLPELNISSEVVLLTAVERYAAHNQLTGTEICEGGNEICEAGSEICEAGSEEVSEQMSRLSMCTEKSPTGPSIRHALQQIRFLSLTPQQFADYCHASTLLTLQEKCDLFMNISSPHLGVEVPEGFSTNREPRSRNTKPEVQDTEMVSLNGTKHCYIRCEGEQDKVDVMRVVTRWWSVIFCSDVERMRELVKEWWNKAIVYVIHEDMPTTQIDTTIQQFHGRGYLIASPSLASRIDMKRVTWCINYVVPTVEGYRHTVARRYLSGYPPLTISLVSSSDELEVVRKIQRSYGIHMEEIPRSGDIWDAVEDYRNKKS